jgi:hypothetical protein
VGSFRRPRRFEDVAAGGPETFIDRAIRPIPLRVHDPEVGHVIGQNLLDLRVGLRPLGAIRLRCTLIEELIDLRVLILI